METPENQQAYAQGYHVGYQHGVEAARGNGPAGGYPFDVVGRRPERSSRLLMGFFFVRPLLLIPHAIVLWFLGMGAFFAMIGAWWAVVITGQYPKLLWDYQTGFMRWATRCQAYALALTDEYPPFSLN